MSSHRGVVFSPGHVPPGAVSETPLRWCQSFRATPDQVSEARRFLASLVAGHPAAADAVTCLSELAANSVQHSRSARPGGTFTVRMCRSGPAIRVEVTDGGGIWRAGPHDPERGRGLALVRALSSRQGITVKGPRTDPSRRTVWFEMPVP